MKKVSLFLLSLMMTSAVFAAGDDDKPIRAEELPAKARQLLSTHFTGDPIRFATLDNDWFGGTYEVHLQSGSEVEFTKEGEWVAIDTEPRPVPEGLIPAPILKEVTDRFPGRTITKIDRDRRDYEAELDNGLELKFNLKFELIGIDD
ncbi:MAG: hypothetical protein E7137_07675 [Rikenellaceae bacterium]|nr:hypothetical protein [Rikenellaceae bacterium]